jgi:hypothetical protein
MIINGKMNLKKGFKFVDFFYLRKCFSNINKTYTNSLTQAYFSNNNIPAPEEYRTVYLENLPVEWEEDDIRIRLEQVGEVERIFILKNSIGGSIGKVVAIYKRIDHLIQAINAFQDKYPFDKPVKVRFYRKYHYNMKKISSGKVGLISENKEVLLIKNIPQELLLSDLKLFITEFGVEPIHISYMKNSSGDFQHRAFVYFTSQKEAETALKYVNLRYVKNKQLFCSFAFNNHPLDITDFRTRIEIGVNNLNRIIEIKFLMKQIQNEINLSTINAEEKIDFLKSKLKLIYNDAKRMNELSYEDDQFYIKNNNELISNKRNLI